MNVLWEVFEIAVNFYQGFIMIFFAFSYLNNDSDNRFINGPNLFFGVLLSTAISLMNYFTVFEHLYALIYIVIIWIYTTLCLNGSKYKKIFAAVFPILILLVLTALSGNLAAMLFDKSLYDILSKRDSERLVTMLAVQAIIFYVIKLSLIALKKDDDDKSDLAVSEWILISVVLFISIIIGAFLNVISFDKLTQRSRLCLLLTLVGVVFINIIVIIIIIDLKRKNLEIIEMSLLKTEKEYNNKFIKIANSEYETIRKLRHDFNDTYSIIYTLIAEGKTDMAMRHIESIQKDMRETEIFVRTDNDIVNAVVNSKMSAAKAFNIDSSCISVNTFDGIDNLDLYRILSNILDNAITACKNSASDNKQIVLKITSDGYTYNFNMKNTIDESVLKNNPNLKTTKENKSDHGYGIKNLRELSEKYRGKCDFYEEDNYFFCNINIMKNCNA